MATEVIMPKLGVDMSEGQIVEWKKKVGDQVNEGDVLVEIMSDKTNMELEAEESGTLIKIVHQDGDTVPVTQTIAYLGEPGEKVGDDGAPAASPEAAQQSAAAAESPQELAHKAVDPSAHVLPNVASQSGVDEGEYDFDIAVIGGGPAGYYGAIHGAQIGAKVALVEKDVVGGTCLNRGCIPTKTYLRSAEIITGIHDAKDRGIMIADPSITVDMNKSLDLKRKVVGQLTGGVKGLLKANGVTVYNGVATVDADKTVHVGDQSFTARKILLANGSKVGRIPIEGIDSKLVMTSDDILELDYVPKSIAVIGGGVIGVEMSEVFSSFGSEITIIEMQDRLVSAADKEISAQLEQALKKQGIKIICSTALERIEDKGSSLVLHLKGGKTVEAERALLSIGRVPDLEGLDALNLELDRGRIKVDKYMQTSIEGIYAPGDVNGIKMLAHAAYRMGATAAENAMDGNIHEIKLDDCPAALYTIPEIGMVGLTEAQAREKYGEVRVGKVAFAGNGRAIASGEAEGFVKVIADATYGQILGIHIIGPCAAEMINQAASLMRLEITINEVLKTIYGHPSFSEALYEACASILNLAVHVPPKR